MRRWMALAMLAVLTVAGCAGRDKDEGGGIATANGGATPTASASTGVGNGKSDDKDAPIKFSQCMREHGLPWFPDPDPGSGGLKMKIPKGQDNAKVDAAMEACKKLVPNGGEPPKLDAAAIEQSRRMAKCMRENGVPNFPDPDANGQIRVDGNKLGIDPENPTFAAADKVCQKYRPKLPAGEPGAGSEQSTDHG
jgi:hypothetical protein